MGGTGKTGWAEGGHGQARRNLHRRNELDRRGDGSWVSRWEKNPGQGHAGNSQGIGMGMQGTKNSGIVCAGRGPRRRKMVKIHSPPLVH